ncbi:putative HNH homing endonuclease [Listeria phage LP-037]|uniref:HNH homing endonuclease n=1 Tax=Listeria phage LP-037 TaxID=1173747 RepID=S4U752_9CAUD|nr:putative HNH homing endonuclease [Listeria phage LP-037]AGI11657.1 putative HNH homing endonuclease [Listeria phage LP-037]
MLEGFVEFLPNYFINREGKVLSNKYSKLKELKGTKHPQKYQQFGFMVDGKHIAIQLHRLLAMAFIPIPEELKNEKNCVDHIDGNPENNSLENLRWTNYQENLAKAGREGQRPMLFTHEEARYMRKEYWEEGVSIEYVAKEFGGGTDKSIYNGVQSIIKYKSMQYVADEEPED